MMNSVQLIAFITFGFLVHSTTVNGLSCFECDSADNVSTCGETLGINHQIELSNCSDVQNVAYCIKHTGLSEGQVGTKRFCSSKDYGNFCEWVTRPGDHRKFRACVYTCSSNACNGAFSRHQVSHLSYTLASLLYGAIMFLRY